MLPIIWGGRIPFAHLGIPLNSNRACGPRTGEPAKQHCCLWQGEVSALPLLLAKLSLSSQCHFHCYCISACITSMLKWQKTKMAHSCPTWGGWVGLQWSQAALRQHQANGKHLQLDGRRRSLSSWDWIEQSSVTAQLPLWKSPQSSFWEGVQDVYGALINVFEPWSAESCWFSRFSDSRDEGNSWFWEFEWSPLLIP